MPVTGLFKAVAFAVISAVAIYSGYYLGKARFGEHTIAVGDAAADFVLDDLDGVWHDTRNYRQQLLLINFWAPWCEPCREEIPLLIQARRTHPEHDLQILGIALDSPSRTRRFRDEYGINYPIFADADHGYRILESYETNGVIPYSVLIGKDGRVLHLKLGPYQHGELERLIKNEARASAHKLSLPP